MNPLISIIVPCYNQAQYLDECLQSVLEQTYENWECIIVNDGSPDDTEVVAKKWLEKDSRFQYLYKKNGGLSSARNAGIKIAKGEYILPLDADDKIGSKYGELALKEFDKDQNLKVVYCLAEKFGDESGSWGLKDFSLLNLSKKNMIFCTSFFRKKDWVEVGGYDVNMIYGLEDWDFWISILKKGGNVIRLNEVCFYYRIKNVSMLKGLSDVNKEKYLYDYLSKKHTDFFIENLGSFNYLNDKYEQVNSSYRQILNDKRKIIDLFCRTFFRFTFFNSKF